MTPFASNLKLLRLKKGLKQAEIADPLGIKVTNWSNYEVGKSEPDLETIVKIANYFEVPVDALLKKGNLFEERADAKNTEKGNLKGNAKGNLIGKTGGKSEVSEPALVYSRPPKVITVDSTGADNVLFVPVRARAGYLAGYEDPEFIQTLPSFRLPNLTHGTFRMFEIHGQSMVPTYHDSDVVIGRYVENFAEIRDDRIYIVVSKQEGVVVKRVVNRIQRDGKLILNSDNQRHPGEYPPIVLDPEDVLEIWYVVIYMSRQMRPPGEIYNRLLDVESRLTIIENDRKKLA